MNKSEYEVLAYPDEIAIKVEGRNSLSNIFKILEKWSEINGIKVNKNKSGIMLIKGIEEETEIEGYPVIKEYKYLVFIDLKNTYDIVIHNKLFEKLNEYEINSKIIGTIKLLYS